MHSTLKDRALINDDDLRNLRVNMTRFTRLVRYGQRCRCCTAGPIQSPFSYRPSKGQKCNRASAVGQPIVPASLEVLRSLFIFVCFSCVGCVLLTCVPRVCSQGLAFQDGFLYESTGLFGGKSSVRKVDPETGEVLQSVYLGKEHFGEGMVILGDEVQSEFRSVFDVHLCPLDSDFCPSKGI